MHRVGLVTFAILGLLVLDLSYTQEAAGQLCPRFRAAARVDTFACPCPDGDNGNLETPIIVVTGSLAVDLRRQTGTLASLVVELHARERRGGWVAVARQVLDATDGSIVETCRGTLTSGPVAGRIVLVDADGNALTFDQVKNVPEGRTLVRYIATFAGAIPTITPGKRTRVKTYTTVMGMSGPGTCTVDADGDGIEDLGVKTFVFQPFARVPKDAHLIVP